MRFTHVSAGSVRISSGRGLATIATLHAARAAASSISSGTIGSSGIARCNASIHCALNG
jgi:hypothetical protein